MADISKAEVRRHGAQSCMERTVILEVDNHLIQSHKQGNITTFLDKDWEGLPLTDDPKRGSKREKG